MQYAHSSTHHSNSDDILAVVQQFAKPSKLGPLLFCAQIRDVGLIPIDLARDFLSEIYRALSQTADVTSDHQSEKLSSTAAATQRCLSVQESLGRHGRVGHVGGRHPRHRTVAAKVAWTTLNLRFCSLNFFFMFSSGAKAGPDGGDLNKPGESCCFFAHESD